MSGVGNIICDDTVWKYSGLKRDHLQIKGGYWRKKFIIKVDKIFHYQQARLQLSNLSFLALSAYLLIAIVRYNISTESRGLIKTSRCRFLCFSKKELDRIFFGKFCFSFFGKFCWAIHAQQHQCSWGWGLSAFTLYEQRSQITLLCPSASEAKISAALD